MNKAMILVLVLIILLIMPIVILLSGCAECISTEYEVVEVEIIDQHHRSAYSNRHAR